MLYKHVLCDMNVQPHFTQRASIPVLCNGCFTVHYLFQTYSTWLNIIFAYSSLQQDDCSAYQAVFKHSCWSMERASAGSWTLGCVILPQLLTHLRCAPPRFTYTVNEDGCSGCSACSCEWWVGWCALRPTKLNKQVMHQDIHWFLDT